MKTRSGRRHGRMAKLRRRVRTEYLVLALVVAGYLAFQTWQEHRLDRLRQTRIEYEERLVVARAGLASANLEYVRQAAQDRVVHRARVELAFVDSRVGERVRLALPSAPAPEEEPLLVRLASGLDRFGGVRAAGAAEGQR
jgi:hypothetical protein